MPLRALALATCLALACSGPPPQRPQPVPLTAPSVPAHAAVREPVPARDPLRPSTAVPEAALLLTDPALLAELEARGLSLQNLLGASGPAASSLLHASPMYRDFVDLVALDDSVAKERDPSAKAAFSASHRLFDIRWLRSARTRFELIGVVNRMDRMFATPERCGEVRLIYRLAYSAPRVSSRLPLTVSLVFAQGDSSSPTECAALAQRWLALEEARRDQLLTRALEGPLQHLELPRLLRVDTNFQSGRWPSAVRPALGGHAEYVLRSFDARAGRLHLTTLENTPTQKLAAGPRAELKRWLRDHLPAIDAGTALIPTRFLAERSVSVQPRGAARLASRPFTQIAAGLGAPPDGMQLVRSEAGLMRRLDQLACKGCHATRSLAGFHLLGEDPVSTSPYNAIAVGLSAHLLAELPFRRAFLESLARAQPFTVPRPFADRGAGRVGDACGLGNDPTFASWTCAEGLACKDRVGDLVGTCATPDNTLGDGVELGRMTQERTGMRDAVRISKVEPCAEHEGKPARAARSADGFPAGMCHAPCTTFGERAGDAICGPLPFGKGTAFDGITKCLTLHDQPFDRCLADDAHPTWLKRCDRDTPCRDDYLCVRVPSGSVDDASGACVPPYFLFQVRVDGHFVERE